MIAASAYIILCTARNRLRARLRRLREPRYLLGAVVGMAYVYFSVFSGRRRAARRRAAGPAAMPESAAALMSAGPTVAGLVLMAGAALGWVAPFTSGLLSFSQAEIDFLFPAPVPRRALLVHRLLRSQIGMVFGAVIVAITAPSLDRFNRLRIAVAMWLLMCTWKIYYTGVTLARSRLADRDRRTRRVAAAPLAAIVAALAVVAVAVWRAMQAAPVSGFLDLVRRVAHAAESPPAAILLWPFTAVARPFFAPWPAPYLTALAGSAIVLVAVSIWVVSSDSAFEAAAEDVNARRELEQARATRRYNARSSAWDLAVHGRPEAAFAWKAAVQTIRLVDRGSALRIVVTVAAFAAAALALGRRSGGDALAAFALAAAAFSILLAPQALRIDLRQDLQQLDILKTWPVRAGAVIRGELLWPGTLLTVIAWALIGVALVSAGGPLDRIDPALRMSGGAAMIVGTPALIFGQLTIHNGMALAFPAWVPLGGQRARGLDVMGQRIILLGGTWLLLGVMLVPALLPAAGVWLVGRMFLGTAAWIAAAFVLTAVMLVEVFVATELLAPLYDGLDLSALERPEE